MGRGINVIGSKKWNPVIGCTKFSEGCRNCYALDRLIPRLQKTNPKYSNGTLVTCHQSLLDVPRKCKKPTTWFVNNMGDVFHPDVPLSFMKDIFQTMNACPRHTFYMLTKRSDRLVQYAPQFIWGSNIWMGVTVESGKYDFRIDDLRKVPVRNRFVMFEPLIGPVGKVDLGGISLALVGGESGTGFRRMDPSWAREIRDQCISSRVKFNFMQYAAVDPRKLGRVLDGREWKELPDEEPQLSLF